MSGKDIFDKPALTVEAQIELLLGRGLEISDREYASHYLDFIGYYRLSAYCMPFQAGTESEDRHCFRHGTTFESIIALYVFDRKLRLLVMDAVERIEVAIKALISNTGSMKYGAHWFLREELFESNFRHRDFLEKIGVSNENSESHHEDFIRYYYRKYSSPEYPPSWMIFEVLSMGTVSMVYKYLNLALKKEIASTFEINHKVLKSWLHTTSYLRNLCAHHSRLWNRTFTIKPKILKRHGDCQNDRFFAQSIIVSNLLNKISPDSFWKDRLAKLFDEYSEIDKSKMGFPEDWLTLPVWS